MNWTTDSWSLQENVVVIAVGQAPELAAEFAQNFEELWTTRNVDATGHQDPRPLEVGRPPGARLVHAGARRGALAPDRQGDRPGARARADRVARDHGGRGARHARRGGRRAAGRTCAAWSTARRWSRSSTSGARTATRPGRSRSSRRVFAQRGLQGQAVHAVHAGDAPRLHAREGHRGGRLGVRRLVQPVALGRDERRERGGGARRRAGGPARRLHRRGARALRAYARA